MQPVERALLGNTFMETVVKNWRIFREELMVPYRDRFITFDIAVPNAFSSMVDLESYVYEKWNELLNVNMLQDDKGWSPKS